MYHVHTSFSVSYLLTIFTPDYLFHAWLPCSHLLISLTSAFLFHTCLPFSNRLTIPHLLTIFTHVPSEAGATFALAGGGVAPSTVHTVALLSAVTAVCSLGAFWEQHKGKARNYVSQIVSPGNFLLCSLLVAFYLQITWYCLSISNGKMFFQGAG